MSTYGNRDTKRKVIAFPQPTNGRKLIVPDTSVLLHDPDSLFRFKEHDVFICRQVLAQLDRHKKGQTDVGRNARQVARTLDTLFRGDRKLMRDGASLATVSQGSATGKLFYQLGQLTYPVPKDALDDEADRRIISVTCALRREHPAYEEIILVTKDINMRFAALGVANVPNGGISVEDYLNDRALVKDEDVLPSGYYDLPEDFWEEHEQVQAYKRGAHDVLHIKGTFARKLSINDCVFLPDDDGVCYKVRDIKDDVVVLEAIANHMAAKNAVWGITARNREQNIALDHLTDPDIDLVILLGDAGTGKTFNALAGGFEYLDRLNPDGVQLRHVVNKHSHDHGRNHHGSDATGEARHDEATFGRIIVTRPMIPVGGEELGFLPGDIRDKFGPWTFAIDDAKEALIRNAVTHRHVTKAAANYGERIKIQPIGLIAGRTLADCFIIVDEAQNLTPHQAKMLITRVGEGSKIVVCGNLTQIDTPFLDEKSSGLAYLVVRMMGQPHVAHVILKECVRSRLAALAVELL